MHYGLPLGIHQNIGVKNNPSKYSTYYYVKHDQPGQLRPGQARPGTLESLRGDGDTSS